MNPFIFQLFLSFPGTWLALHTLAYLIKIKSRRWKQLLVFFGCWLLHNIPIFIGDAVNILIVFSCFLLFILVSCEGSLWKKITVGSMYASTIFSFNALRDTYLMLPFYIRHMDSSGGLDYITSRLFLIFLTNISFTVFLYMGIRKLAPDKDYVLSDSLWRLLLLLTLPPLGIILAITALHGGSTPFALEYPALLSISLLSFISLLWCITVLARQQKLEHQNMFMEINRKYYDAMEQQHFEVRRLKHDLANHIQVLAALPEEQQKSYIQNLSVLAKSLQPLWYCEDATVNAVLSVKSTAMDRCGIPMEVSVDIPSSLPFHKTDVCALYANALDNAMEACMKLEKPVRSITLKSTARKGLFCLEVRNPVPDTCTVPENSAECPPDKLFFTFRKKPSGRHKDLTKYRIGEPGCILPTSKEDAANHGFGLRSIREIVTRYHGSMEWKVVDGVFELFLYIPL